MNEKSDEKLCILKELLKKKGFYWKLYNSQFAAVE